MGKPQISLATLLFVAAFLPAWIYLMVALAEWFTVERAILVAITLGLIAVGLQRFVREPVAWAFSILVVGGISLVALALAAWWRGWSN
jgi:hypothetical protein